jgi:hypothetical protein
VPAGGAPVGRSTVFICAWFVGSGSAGFSTFTAGAFAFALGFVFAGAFAFALGFLFAGFFFATVDFSIVSPFNSRFTPRAFPFNQVYSRPAAGTINYISHKTSSPNDLHDFILTKKPGIDT